MTRGFCLKKKKILLLFKNTAVGSALAQAVTLLWQTTKNTAASPHWIAPYCNNPYF